MIYPYPDSLSWPQHSGLYDRRLDVLSRGLLLACLTDLPPETRVTIRALCAQTGMTYKRLQRAVRQLQTYQYAVKRPGRLERGRWGSTYFDIYSVPEPIYRAWAVGLPDTSRTAIMAERVNPASTRTAIEAERVNTAQMSPPLIEPPNGHNGRTGKVGLSPDETMSCPDTTHPNGHNGRTYSFSSLDLKEREKEDAHPNGHHGQTGEPCAYFPSIPCAHYRAAMAAIETELAAAYPNFHLRVRNVYREVFETVHHEAFSLEAIALIYRYLVARGEKPEWLWPNKVLSFKARDEKLALAQAWAAGQAPRPEAPCPHPGWQLYWQGNTQRCKCGEVMGEGVDPEVMRADVERFAPSWEEPQDAV